MNESLKPNYNNDDSSIDNTFGTVPLIFGEPFTVFPSNEKNFDFLGNDIESINFSSVKAKEKLNQIFSNNKLEKAKAKESNINKDSSNERTTYKTPLFEIKRLGRKRLNIDVKNNDNVYKTNDNKRNEELHDKNTKDNIMRKIKKRIFDYIIEKLNDNLRNKNNKFCKLDTKLNEYLKKEFNVELLQRTIMDIISNYPINKKYKKEEYINKTNIEKILKEKREIKVRNILNMKLIDIINEIRNDEDNLFYFLEKIKDKEESIKQKKNINIQEYIKKVRELLFGYENWFLKKFSRKSKEKNNKNENN